MFMNLIDFSVSSVRRFTGSLRFSILDLDSGSNSRNFCLKENSSVQITRGFSLMMTSPRLIFRVAKMPLPLPGASLIWNGGQEDLCRPQSSF